VYATVRATQWGDSILEFRVYGLTTIAPITGGTGNGGNGVCPWVNSTAPVAQRVQQLLNTMNQSEEFTLLSGDGGSSYIGQVAAIPNLCIKPMNMQDGPTGVGDGTGGVTAYADGENAAATWDPALIQQEGAAMGAEFAGKGVNVSLGPTTNLVRDPRWGRTYETYGEDPYLAGQITSAEVTGLQSQGVQAMVKHVAAYDQEQYPNGNNNETVSEQALQELYLAPFQSAIYQSAPASFMCSYAVVNSAASCQNADMQIKGLKQRGELRWLHHLRLGRRLQQRCLRRRRYGDRDAVPRIDPHGHGQRDRERHAEPVRGERGGRPDPDPDVRVRHVRQPGDRLARHLRHLGGAPADRTAAETRRARSY